MAFRISCPSCNTAFVLPQLPVANRATCPRCGDQFAIRTFTEIERTQAAETEAPAALPSSLQDHRATRMTRGRWSVTRSILVALSLGLLGLGAGLWYRQSSDRTPTPEDTPTPRRAGEVVPATRLQGLRYLPADCNVAFGVQMGPILEYAVRTDQNPRELLIKGGVPERLLDALRELGLTLPQIDHIAGGAFLGDAAFELRFTLVLVLNRPHDDEDAFLKQLKVKAQAGGRTRFDGELANLPVVVARVSPTIWVFGLDPKKDLEAFDRGGYDSGASQFPAKLAEMIAQRVPPSAAIWAATDDGVWADKPAIRLAATATQKPEWLPILKQARAALLAISFGEEPRGRLFVKTIDASTGQKLRDYFRDRAATDDKVQHGGGGELAFLELPINPADAFTTLQRLLSEATKK